MIPSHMPSAPTTFRFSLRHLFELVTCAAVAAWLYSFHDVFAASVRLLLFCYGYLAFRAGFLSRVFGISVHAESYRSSGDHRKSRTAWYAVLPVLIVAGPAAAVFGWLGFGFLMGQGVPGPGFLAHPVLVFFFLGGAAAGATTGALCALFCGARLGRPFAWPFATTIGWLVGLFLLVCFVSLYSRTPAHLYVALSTFGLVAGGLLQSSVAGFDERAARWAGRGTCLGLLLTAILEISGAGPSQSYWHLPMAWALGTLGGAIGAVFAAEWTVTRVTLCKTVSAASACAIIVLSSALLISEALSHRTGFSEIARLKTPGLVSCIAVSPDGRKLIAGTRKNESSQRWQDQLWTGSLYVWDTSTWSPIIELPQPRWVNSMDVSPDGRTLAVACGTLFHGTSRERDLFAYEPEPGAVKLFDLASMREQKILPFDGGVYAVEFSPDGAYLAALIGGTTDGAGMLILWDTETLTERGRLEGLRQIRHGANILDSAAMCFSPDGTHLAIAESRDSNRKRSITLWNVVTKEKIIVDFRNGGIVSLAFDPKGESLFVVAFHGLFVLNLRSHSSVSKAFSEPVAHARALAISPTGTVLVVGGSWSRSGASEYGGATLRGFPEGDKLGQLKLNEPHSIIHSLEFSPDENLLYTGLANGEIIVWKIQK